MRQTNLGDILSNTLRWLIIPEKSHIFTLSEQSYFGNIKIVSLEELADRYFSPESYDTKILDMINRGYCLQSDPKFHDFILNRPKPNARASILARIPTDKTINSKHLNTLP